MEVVCDKKSSESPPLSKPMSEREEEEVFVEEEQPLSVVEAVDDSMPPASLMESPMPYSEASNSPDSRRRSAHRERWRRIAEFVIGGESACHVPVEQLGETGKLALHLNKVAGDLEGRLHELGKHPGKQRAESRLIKPFDKNITVFETNSTRTNEGTGLLDLRRVMETFLNSQQRDGKEPLFGLEDRSSKMMKGPEAMAVEEVSDVSFSQLLGMVHMNGILRRGTRNNQSLQNARADAHVVRFF
jgi:hypothetical protein